MLTLRVDYILCEGSVPELDRGRPGAAGADGKPVDRNRILLTLRERIVAYAASRLQRDVAEDLAQEVLMVIETKYARVEALEELLPLCFQIVRYKMMGLHRKSARRGEYKQVPVDDLPLADPAPNPEIQAERKQMQERLTAALERLDCSG